MPNKVAIVTGSGQGIGKAIALELATRGIRVVLNGRNEQKLIQTQQELRQTGVETLVFSGDITSWDTCTALVDSTLKHFGRLDIMVCNAGTLTKGSVHTMSPEVISEVLKVNVLGSVFPAKAAISALRASKGSVVFVSSVASFYGLPYSSVYSASKRSLDAFAQALRLEEREHGIHVGIVYVGFTENEPHKEYLKPNGKIAHLEQRKGIKKLPRELVAKKIVDVIVSRKDSLTLSFLGVLNNYLSRIFPGFVKAFLYHNLNKIKEQSAEPV